MTCSCGELECHVIARRTTFDGKHVCLWSDGSLTWAFGHAIKGSAFPRTAEQTERALRAGWLVIGEVEIHNADDVSDLVAAARFVAERSGLPGDVRARLAAMREPKGPAPVWNVLASDRDGRPTLRVWRLPRLGWPGLAVWHERGRYEVMRALPGRGADTYEPTGFKASTMREVRALLVTLRSV
jgi:hypothetical protein